MKRTVDFYGASLLTLRKSYGCYLGSRQSTPLPLNAQLVLVPIKMRCPVVVNDSVTGFVNACNVLRIEPSESVEGGGAVKCILQLNGGLSVPSYFSQKQTEKRLLLGRLALDRFCHLHGIYSNRGTFMFSEKPGSADHNKYTTIGKLIYELIIEKESNK